MAKFSNEEVAAFMEELTQIVSNRVNKFLDSIDPEANDMAFDEVPMIFYHMGDMGKDVAEDAGLSELVYGLEDDMNEYLEYHNK